MNFRRGECPLKIQGVDFVIKFDFEAFCELEDAMGGKPLSKILAEDTNGFSTKFLRAAVYAGLQWDPRFKKKFDLKKASELVHKADLKELQEAIAKAIAAALPDMPTPASTEETPASPEAGEESPLENLIGMDG